MKGGSVRCTKMGDVENMVNMNNNGTLVQRPYGTMDGGKIRPCLQYGWSEWLMNMPIRTRCDLHGGTKIEVTPGYGLKKVGR